MTYRDYGGYTDIAAPGWGVLLLNRRRDIIVAQAHSAVPGNTRTLGGQDQHPPWLELLDGRRSVSFRVRKWILLLAWLSLYRPMLCTWMM